MPETHNITFYTTDANSSSTLKESMIEIKFFCNNQSIKQGDIYIYNILCMNGSNQILKIIHSKTTFFVG